jgi:hypothetical protein
LVKDTALDVMMCLGMRTAQDVYKVGASMVVRDLLASTPMFKLHALIRHTFWGGLEWMTCDWKYGKPLAAVVLDWLASFEPATAGQEWLPRVTGPSAENANTIMKALIVLHRAKVFTVQDLCADHGWGLKEFVALEATVSPALTKPEYRQFVECVQGNPAARRLASPRVADVTTLLQEGASGPQQGHIVRSSMPAMDARAWAQMEGLIWE